MFCMPHTGYFFFIRTLTLTAHLYIYHAVLEILGQDTLNAFQLRCLETDHVNLMPKLIPLTINNYLDICCRTGN